MADKAPESVTIGQTPLAVTENTTVIAPGAELSGTARPVRPVQVPEPYIDSPELFVRPPSFEQRMGATIQAAAISTEGAGKNFAMSFRLVLEHAFHAQFAKFKGDVSAFETNVRMHIEELFNRGKETGGYIK